MYKNISSPNLHSINITKNIHITNMWKNSTSHQKSTLSSAKPNTTPPSGSWLPRQEYILLILLNKLLSIAHIMGTNPRILKVIVPLPLDEVLSPISTVSMLHYSLNLILNLTLNLNATLTSHISNLPLKLGDMKNIMYTPVNWQLQPICYTTNTRNNIKRSSPQSR